VRRATCLALVLSVCPSLSAEPIVPENAKLEKVWGEGTFTEGPAYGPDGCVYFSDIGNRIMRFDPATGKTTVYREPSGRSNGLDFDAAGRLVACEGADNGNRRVSITEKDGKVRALADNWRASSTVNDLTIDRRASTSATRGSLVTKHGSIPERLPHRPRRT
jgi:gluconolactonase